MRPHRYADYKFENPPFLQLLWERAWRPLFGRRPMARLLEAGKIAPGDRVLDFGCGGGIEALCLCEKIGPEGRLTCVDVSGFWLGLCRRRLKGRSNVEFHQGDVRNLPIPDAGFDLVFIHNVIRWIEEKDRPCIVECLGQKLAPTGKILLCERMAPRMGYEAHVVRRIFEKAGLAEDFSRREGALLILRCIHAKRNERSRARLVGPAGECA